MTTNEEQFAIDESEFERDVTAIVRKVLTQEIRNVQINLEDQLTEKLQDILKRRDAEEDKKIASNARHPIQIAPMVAIASTVDPETVDAMAWHAALAGQWVAVVYDTMDEIPRIPATVGKYENGDVKTVCRAYGQQSVTLKSGGRILWLAKDLRGGRGVSVNLVLRVQRRGLCIANEEALWARPTEPVHERPPLSPYGNTSDQVWYNIHRVIPVGAGYAITSNHIFDKVKALGGAIFPDSVYVEVLRRMVAETVGVHRRFSGQWLYYRDA